MVVGMLDDDMARRNDELAVLRAAKEANIIVLEPTGKTAVGGSVMRMVVDVVLDSHTRTQATTLRKRRGGSGDV